MKIIAAIALLLASAHAGEVKLAWNPQAADDFRVWRGIQCLATVTQPQATLTLPDSPCVITVTARNAAGESAHSAPLEIIAVTVQESTDLKTWAMARTIHRERKPAAFFRLKLEVAP